MCKKNSGTPRVKQSDVVLEFLNRGLILIDEYINKDYPMMAYTKDGYIIYSTRANIVNRNQGYSPFIKSNPYSMHNIRLWLGRNMPHIDVFDGEVYNGNNHQIKCKCNVCGNTIYKKWSSLLAKEGCAICANKVPFTIDSLKEKVKEIRPDIEILSDEYVNANEKLIVRCSKGHIIEQSYCSISSGHGCYKCRIERFRLNKVSRRGKTWSSDIDRADRFFRSKLKSWKFDSIKSCGYKCVITGERFDAVHHIVGFNFILKEAHEKFNVPIKFLTNEYSEYEIKLITEELIRLHYLYGLGVCLKFDLHEEFHALYGKGNNTKEQWLEFYNSKINKREDDDIGIY